MAQTQMMIHILQKKKIEVQVFDSQTILFQRKGRGGDELKSFDEMEMMTSELEETSAPQNQDEEDKTSGETLGV